MGTGRLLAIVDEVESTNDEALGLGRGGAPAGHAVAARRQSAGRGRRGHVWESPAGNLYLSVVLRPGVTRGRLPGLAAACALGVTDGLSALGIGDEVRLKWPNDVFARGRKLGGILVEASRDDAGRDFAVCGVGVNLERAPRALEAVCLADLGAETSFSELAETLRRAIAARVDSWARADGALPLDGIRDDYLSRLVWLGERVRVLASRDGSELARGGFQTVDPWGRAVVDGTPYPCELASLRPLSPSPSPRPSGHVHSCMID